MISRRRAIASLAIAPEHAGSLEVTATSSDGVIRASRTAPSDARAVPSGIASENDRAAAKLRTSSAPCQRKRRGFRFSARRGWEISTPTVSKGLRCHHGGRGQRIADRALVTAMAVRKPTVDEIVGACARGADDGVILCHRHLRHWWRRHRHSASTAVPSGGGLQRAGRQARQPQPMRQDGRRGAREHRISQAMLNSLSFRQA